MHYIPKQVETRLSVYSPEWLDAEEQRLAEEIDNRKMGNISDWGVEQADLDAVFQNDDADDWGF